MICFHLVAVAMGFWCKLLNSYLTNHQFLRCEMNIVLPSIMSKWPQRIVFTDRLSISAQIAVQFIPEDDEKNKSSQFIFFPEILQSWIMIWFVTVSARDLNVALFTFFPSEKNNTFFLFYASPLSSKWFFKVWTVHFTAPASPSPVCRLYSQSEFLFWMRQSHKFWIHVKRFHFSALSYIVLTEEFLFLKMKLKSDR